MFSANSLSSLNSITLGYSGLNLSKETISELKELGINISGISSEAQARKIIEEKSQKQENANKTQQDDDRLEKIYQRIKTLAMKINISISSSEKIENALIKINSKISLFEENNNNANISAIRSEYDSIKYTYETLTSTKADIFTGRDMLGKTNRIIMGIKK
ncbi:hypothetical protein IJ182_01055 [bacterium]|nr:hypothetical protein [bacterium]